MHNQQKGKNMAETQASLLIRPVDQGDFDAWLPHWKSYQEFYKVDPPNDVTEATWQRFFDKNEACVLCRGNPRITTDRLCDLRLPSINLGGVGLLLPGRFVCFSRIAGKARWQAVDRIRAQRSAETRMRQIVLAHSGE